jgi:XTP/dITP diphosphohydrolase
MRKFTEEKLVLATHNAGKVVEIAALLAPFNVSVISAGDLGLPEPEETEKTFTGNAALKALAAAKAANLPALADDSGLSVNALNGDPGIYSARWAGPEKDFAKAMRDVNAQMADHPDRGGQFICALALAWPDGHVETFEGILQGQLVWPMRGTKGFGYDPMFIPNGYDRTFGEMDKEEKQTMSHRAKAFKLLVESCFN